MTVFFLLCIAFFMGFRFYSTRSEKELLQRQLEAEKRKSFVLYQIANRTHPTEALNRTADRLMRQLYNEPFHPPE